MDLLARLVALVAVAALIFSCGQPDHGTASSEPLAGAGGQMEPDGNGTTLHKVTSQQAERAVSDAMVATGMGLLLALNASKTDQRASTDDGHLVLSWTSNADFATGLGLYTVTLDNYSVPPEDPAADEYGGYLLTGTATTGSNDGVRQILEFDLQASHPNPEQFPVERIDLSVSGSAEEGATGHVVINGHPISLEDLATVFATPGMF